MNIEELQKLVQQGESLQLEFKASTSQIKAAFETVCAFLNNKGGTILLGIKNNGEIIGQNVTDNTRLELANEIKKIEPHIHIEIHYVPISNDKLVIVLEIPAGEHIPYAYDGRPYQRTISSTTRMTQHRYEQLIIQRGHLNHKWEEFLTDEFTIEDLDHEEIKRTIEEGIFKNRISTEARHYSIEQILINFKLIRDNQLTNAAVALFAKNPDKIFNCCEIKMARFRGRNKLGGFIDNQWERGNAFHLIGLAHHFASRHLPIASFFEPGKIERFDQPAVPQLALREALTNAFCHRDYNIRGATPSLAIYDDRLELWNPGCLLPKVKVEQLKGPHHSYPRNELIAQVFYKRGWIEQWGTGTTRMVEYCKNNRSPEPEFSEDGGGFFVIFPFNEAMNTAAGTPTLTVNDNQHLTSRQKEIVNILAQVDNMTALAINQKLQKSLPERTMRYELANLKEKGIVSSSGSTRDTIWFLIK